MLDAAKARAFMRDHWQAAPVFFPQALPHVPGGIDWRALAVRDDVEARRVSGRETLRLEHGPFSAAQLTDAADADPWTVLIQDADQFEPALRTLLEVFDFLPRWRLEDVMLSVATPGASVGPHVDAYDVFLVQTEGRRHWRVGAVGSARPAPEGGELRQVLPFEALVDVVAAPGDVLYVPPGAPHHGVAKETCLTCSVGFRAPRLAELAAVLAESCDVASRYADRDLGVTDRPGRIDPVSVARAHTQLLAALPHDRDAVAGAFGRLLTEPKDWLWPEPPEQTPTRQALQAALRAAGQRLRCHTATRLAYSEPPLMPRLYVNGEQYSLDAVTVDAAAELANRRALAGPVLVAAVRHRPALDLLATLIETGAIVFCDDP